MHRRMCPRQEHCVKTRNISLLHFLRQELELKRFEGTCRLFCPEYRGSGFFRNLYVSTRLHVSQPIDRILHRHNRDDLLFNKLRVLKDRVVRKSFGPKGSNVQEAVETHLMICFIICSNLL
jgi:hypothetical protein